MSHGTSHPWWHDGLWLLAFMFKEFLADFVRRLGEKTADRVSRMRTYIRNRKGGK